MATVVFDPTRFKARYPQFAAVDNAFLQSCFDEGGNLYLTNNDSSPVQSVTRRELLLWMLTAHIATLNGALTGDVAPVGRTSSATEGSVSASLEYLTPGSHSWFTQTQYGAAFWQATLPWRTFTYIAQPVIIQ